MKRIKRFLCLLLAWMLLMGSAPGALYVNATQEDGICELHHAVHDVNVCGYVAAVQEIPCGHVHSEVCYQQTRCLHSCTEECPDPCNHECTVENGCITMVRECHHAHGDCAYREATQGTPCDHICKVIPGSADSCYKLLCTHAEEGQHDDVCGFSESVEGQPCSFAGKECVQCAEEKQCHEKCMNPGGHDGDCVLYCENEYCAKAQNHEDECAMACGCPVTVPEHLETCAESAVYSMPKQLYGAIDGNSVTEMTVAEGSIGPNMAFRTADSGEVFLENVVSSNPGIARLIQNGNSYQIAGMEAGETTLTYTDTENQVFSMKVVVEERVLTAQMEGTSNINPQLSMRVGQKSNVSFYLYGDNSWRDAVGGTFASSNSNILQVVDYSHPEHVCQLTAMAAGSANVIFTSPSGAELILPVTVEQSVVAKVGNDTYNELYFTTGMHTSVTFYLSGSNTPLTVEAGSNAISLTAGANGSYTLKALRQGISSVVYRDANGKQYSCPVIVSDPMVTKGYLYHYASDNRGNNYPVTCTDLPMNMEYRQWFYFGDTPIDIDDENFSFSGPITVEADNAGQLVIKATGLGTGYLEYRSKDSADGPVITNCFVVNVVQDRNSRPSGTSTGSYMRFGDTVIGFGDTGRTFNDAENMILDHEVTDGFNNVYQEQYRQKALLSAIKSNGQPNMTLLQNGIDNVKFSVLSAVYADETPAEADRLKATAASWYTIDSTSGVGTWMSSYEARGKLQFYAKVGMQFDLEDGTDIRRISLYTGAHNVFMGDEVRVVAHDIDSAAKLNVILSSRESLLNWIADKAENETGHPDDMGLECASTAATINIILPKADLKDAVVVSQAIGNIPFTEKPISTPDFRIVLEGQGSNHTKMAGFISKGSVFGIINIGFEAVPSITMTRGTQTFTCGILADPKWNGTVVYDTDYMAKFGENPGGRTLDSWQNALKDWHCDVPTVSLCSFDGFAYGTYSTENGYVGSGYGNTFDNCYYGIYIDSAGKTGWINKKASADYSGYRFHKNVYAVYIEGLQQNMTPYDFRIHDSDFINNHIEFAIKDYSDTYLQNYYFYRNHYRGNWNGETVGWIQHMTPPQVSGNNSNSHRGPKYEVLGKNGAVVSNGVNVKISGTPGKASANFSAGSRSAGEGYWIYDGAEQLTRIIADEELPIAQESLNALKADADVSIVNQDGQDTIAIWTFEGGE